MAISPISTTGNMTRMQDVGASFAADLKDRIAQNNKALLEKEAAAEANAVEGVDAAAASGEKSQKQTQLDALESALSGTVSYMAEKHGEKPPAP